MTTKHSHGPNFGRHVDDCLRCQELKDGAEPVSAFNRPVCVSGSKTTKHNHAPRYGQKFDDCPRCSELKAGAEPVRWAPSRAQQDAERVAEIRAHDCETAGCSIVCTFGQW
ncbi:hypothetical protein ACIRLA_22115 [Streptomyces sp. NPDC102364]|uniref:hypothetical protein n=1 Tax=Streptomyces sp. NPDC102364 TaxID=3366161 RepID=UPI0037FD1A3B